MRESSLKSANQDILICEDESNPPPATDNANTVDCSNNNDEATLSLNQEQIPVGQRGRSGSCRGRKSPKATSSQMVNNSTLERLESCSSVSLAKQLSLNSSTQTHVSREPSCNNRTVKNDTGSRRSTSRELTSSFHHRMSPPEYGRGALVNSNGNTGRSGASRERRSSRELSLPKRVQTPRTAETESTDIRRRGSSGSRSTTRRGGHELDSNLGKLQREVKGMEECGLSVEHRSISMAASGLDRVPTEKIDSRGSASSDETSETEEFPSNPATVTGRWI